MLPGGAGAANYEGVLDQKVSRNKFTFRTQLPLRVMLFRPADESIHLDHYSIVIDDCRDTCAPQPYIGGKILSREL
jgi:hypothetical protein